MSGYPLFLEVNASSLRPRQRALWEGWPVECERQARRTTFLRVVDPDLDGARVQIKRTQRVLIEIPGGTA